jgi:hypothetical protein
MADIKKGDEVSWKTSQGTTHGKVVDHKTKPFTFDGQKFNASEDEPYVVIESDKSGKQAAHKVSSVTKK